MPKTLHTPHELAIIARADTWHAYAFFSRNQKFSWPFASLDDARGGAQVIADRLGKPAIIYASCKGAQAYVETVQPSALD